MGSLEQNRTSHRVVHAGAVSDPVPKRHRYSRPVYVYDCFLALVVSVDCAGVG